MPLSFTFRYLGNACKAPVRIMVLLLLILVCSADGYTQPKMDKTQILRLEKTADSLYNLDDPTNETDELALRLFTIVGNADSLAGNHKKIYSLIRGGNIHQGHFRYKLANEFYHRALSLNRPMQPDLAYEAYLYLGSSMYFDRIMDSAQYYFELASNFSEEFRKTYKLKEQDRLYNSLGAIYFEAANYRQAMNYFQTALMLSSPPKIDEFREFNTTIQSNLAQCLLKLNQVDSSLRILKSLNPVKSQKDIILQNIAHAYFEKGIYDTALQLYSRLPVTKGLHRILALNDIGRIYLKQGKWKLSAQMFDSAIAENKRTTGKVKNKEEALSYLSKSELSDKLNRTDEAISWCNKALEEIHFSYSANQPFDIPQLVSRTVSPIIFYQILNYKAQLIYKKYVSDKNPETLLASLKTVVKAVESANFISKNLDNDDAKQFFIENAQTYYEQAVKIAYEAGTRNQEYLHELIFILEGYKGNILRQNLEFTNLKLNSGIPDSLIRKEKDLKGLYAVYLSKLNQAINEKESGLLQQKLDSIQVSLSRLQKSYEKYEVFTWVKNSQTDHRLTIDEIRSRIDGKTAMVNYFLTANELYILAISKSSVKAAKVAIDPVFRNDLKKYLQECFRITEGFRYEGFSAAHNMYRYLLEPVYNLIGNCSRLIIIPDKYLFQVPFDGIITTSNPRDYLVKKHSISFHYSFSLLLQGMESPTQQNPGLQGILAFAPFAPDLKKISIPGNYILPFSDDEISTIQARKYFSSSATKQQFLKHYKNYGILHLATHASLGNDSSSNWIQFYPGKESLAQGRLYVHEVYNLHLEKNGLVILSACESGSGLTVSGEGLLSISRAFMYAGAGGIISTLYKTDDRVTAYLMKRLYFHMENGLDPATALQKSKIDLLETNELNPRLKTPNYWSNFIYAGRIPSETQSDYLWILLFALAALLLTAFVIYAKKRRILP